MAYEIIHQSEYETGAPVTVDLLTKMIGNTNHSISLSAFPKIATFEIPTHVGASNGRKRLPLASSLNGDDVGVTIVSGNALQFTPGEYYIEIPMKFYVATTCYVFLKNLTTGLDEADAYAHPYTSNSMDNAHLKKRLTITETTDFGIEITTSANNYHYDVTGNIMKIRDI